MKSLVLNWFVSREFQARSSTVGRLSRGPTPSSQLYPETKFPPGYPHDRHAQALDLGGHVLAEPFLVGELRAGLVHAGIDGAAEVLEERPEHPPVQVRPPARRLQHRPRRPARLRIPEGGKPGA